MRDHGTIRRTAVTNTGRRNWFHWPPCPPPLESLCGRGAYGFNSCARELFASGARAQPPVHLTESASNSSHRPFGMRRGPSLLPPEARGIVSHLLQVRERVTGEFVLAREAASGRQVPIGPGLGRHRFASRRPCARG